MNKYDIRFLEELNKAAKHKSGVKVCLDLLSEEMKKVLGFNSSVDSVVFAGVYIEKEFTATTIPAPEWMKDYEG